MAIWRCFLTIMILLLIMFPPSWISSNFLARAGESQHLNPRVPVEDSCSNKAIGATVEVAASTCLASTVLEAPSADRSPPSENWLDFVSRKLRGLLWGITRGIQRHPLKAWMAELELSTPSRSEEVAVEVESNAIA